MCLFATSFRRWFTSPTYSGKNQTPHINSWRQCCRIKCCVNVPSSSLTSFKLPFVTFSLSHRFIFLSPRSQLQLHPIHLHSCRCSLNDTHTHTKKKKKRKKNQNESRLMLGQVCECSTSGPTLLERESLESGRSSFS